MRLNRRHFSQGLTAGLLLSGSIAAGRRSAFAAVDEDDLLEPGELADMFIGEEDAPVTIIEYASLTCPHCRAFHVDTYPELKEKHIDTGQARLIFREFPFDDAALAAFMLARCAGEDKYFAMIDVLFEQQAIWTSRDRNVAEELFKIARLAGFTEASFQECLTNVELAQGIRAMKDHAALNFGVRSTPTFFINGEQLDGNYPLSRFDEIIEDIIG